MKERDYLWCLVNELLDQEELLDRLCPSCRARATEERCPRCGTALAETGAGINPAFDMERFTRMKEAEAR